MMFWYGGKEICLALQKAVVLGGAKGGVGQFGMPGKGWWFVDAQGLETSRVVQFFKN